MISRSVGKLSSSWKDGRVAAMNRRRGLVSVVAVLGILLTQDGILAGANSTFADIQITPHSLNLLLGTKGSIQVSIFNNFEGTFPLKLTRTGVAEFAPSQVVYPTPNVHLVANVTVTAVGPGSAGLVFDAPTATAPSTGDTLVPAALDAAALVVTVVKSNVVAVAAVVVGWVYFTAWSVSFYPQIYCNWRRKSVVGLSFDFVALNALGFTAYSVFNVGFFFVPAVREQFLRENPGSIVQVEANDVAFGIHALAACLLTAFQCLVYERGNQRISVAALAILACLTVFGVVVTVLGAVAVVTWLRQLVLLSYIKLAVTAVKYVPQALLNFRRKSTVGWSIVNILLDFTGGVLSLFQMILLSYNQDAWNSIFGNPTKLGLSLLSIGFDLLFMTQHYILYRNAEPYAAIDDSLPRESTIEDAIFGRCPPGEVPNNKAQGTDGAAPGSPTGPNGDPIGPPSGMESPKAGGAEPGSRKSPANV